MHAAVKAINASNKTVCFEIVGYLLEELRDPTNFATFKEDLANANVFIGSLIFIEELAEKVIAGHCACTLRMRALGCARRAQPHSPARHMQAAIGDPHPPPPRPCPLCRAQIVEAVDPVRERLDACVIFPSMPAVMKLNKLGTFSMAQLGQSKSMIGEFIK